MPVGPVMLGMAKRCAGLRQAQPERLVAREPAWPKADVVIGNPPFLGDKKMRGELGDA